MEQAFWQDIADRILQKERAVAARNAGKIPYTAKDGVFDDMGKTNLCWWTNGFYAGLLWQLYGWSREEIFRTAAQTIETFLRRRAWITTADSSGCSRPSPRIV